MQDNTKNITNTGYYYNQTRLPVHHDKIVQIYDDAALQVQETPGFNNKNRF